MGAKRGSVPAPKLVSVFIFPLLLSISSVRGKTTHQHCPPELGLPGGLLDIGGPAPAVIFGCHHQTPALRWQQHPPPWQTAWKAPPWQKPWAPSPFQPSKSAIFLFFPIYLLGGGVRRSIPPRKSPFLPPSLMLLGLPRRSIPLFPPRPCPVGCEVIAAGEGADAGKDAE